MSLNVLAQAELSTEWSTLAPRLAAAAAAVAGARWVTWTPYPGAVGSQAAVLLDPADPLTVTCSEGLLSAQATTSPWGPGYHRRVVAVLDALGDALDGGWGRVVDDTDYAASRDGAQLERSFLRWAWSLWDVGPGPAVWLGARVGLVLGEGPAEVPSGSVATPLGFRDAAWVASVQQGLRQALTAPGALSPAARQAFLWWHDPPDATDWVQMGRAICTSEVIWRPVSLEGAPAQVEARRRAAACFAEARRLDPTIEVPEAEWSRLRALEGEGDPATDAAEPFVGGYREGWIRRLVGGRWNVNVPGWFRGGCGPDGHDVFWDDAMTVHVSIAVGGAGAFSAAAEADRHLEAWARPTGAGRGSSRSRAARLPATC